MASPSRGQVRGAGSLSPLPCYSAAAQVRRPGPAQPPVPGGDRPRLVWKGEWPTLGGEELGTWAPLFAQQAKGASGYLLLLKAILALGSPPQAPTLLSPSRRNLGSSGPFSAGLGIRCLEGPPGAEGRGSREQGLRPGCDRTPRPGRAVSPSDSLQMPRDCQKGDPERRQRSLGVTNTKDRQLQPGRVPGGVQSPFCRVN